jgi:hypothetical protein
LDSGLSDVWIFGGFLRMLVGFFRMLAWIFDIGFGHLVFPDLAFVVCWYKDGKHKGRKETYSTKDCFYATKEKNARRTV